VTRLMLRLPPEEAHHLAMRGLRLLLGAPVVRAAVRARLLPHDPVLRTEALGLSFPNPVGLAAGFDKDARAYRELGALGFGFVEVGTLTALAQRGNPRPRLFRLPGDRALINRLGFNNGGARAARGRLSRRTPVDGVVGVNVGRTRRVSDDAVIADYRASVTALAPVADYLVVNVSSPNTPGLRALQHVDQLRPLLQAVQAAAAPGGSRRPPALLVKIAPDLTDEELDAIADLALELGLAGIVATNTTIGRARLTSSPEDVAGAGAGGLSGAPLKARSLHVLERLRARAGDRLVLVAAGGIENSADAWERIRAGATLVQIYTGLVYGGPLTPSRLARGLARRATRDGFARVQDAVGVGRGTAPRATLDTHAGNSSAGPAEVGPDRVIPGASGRPDDQP
jgi:dihydroorotate dehydrogenase